MKNEKACYIVIHSNYADGKDAYAFENEADAKKSVDEDVKTILADLAEQGREPVVLQRDSDGAELYVADSDIYYEWLIVMSTIRGR